MSPYYDDFKLDFNHPTKSLLEQEQELLNRGYTEDDLSRLYPNVVGNQHYSGCCCNTCDPESYADRCGRCGSLFCDGECRITLPELPPIMLNWQSTGHPDGEPCDCSGDMGCLYEHPF